MSTHSIRALEIKPWKAVAQWAEHKRRLEEELKSMSATIPELPWESKHYPFWAPPVGGAGATLFLKFMLYAARFGGERLKWIGADRAKEVDASFFGIVRVYIPATDRAAYSALCGVYPLKCEFVDAGLGPRKTLDKNLKWAGMTEYANKATRDVELCYDRETFDRQKVVRQREERRRAVVRRTRVAVEALKELAAPPLTMLPSLAETLDSDGWKELKESRMALEETQERVLRASGALTELLGSLEGARKRVLDLEREHDSAKERLRSATDAFSDAERAARSVRARLVSRV